VACVVYFFSIFGVWFVHSLLDEAPVDDESLLDEMRAPAPAPHLARQPRRVTSACGLLLYPRVGNSMRVETKLGDFPVTVTTLDLTQPWSEMTGGLLRDLDIAPA
jgi:hypothetical protein